MMKRLLGGPGTISGFLLRFGQCAFGAASIAIMATALGFSSYTAFWFYVHRAGLSSTMMIHSPQFRAQASELEYVLEGTKSPLIEKLSSAY